MEGNREQKRKELNEAILAGERTLQSLNIADEALGSAKHWGVFDMIGGGILSTYFKHSRLDRAKSCIADAKQALKVFQNELADVSQVMELSIPIGDFLTFADFFFDGFFVDWVVQSRIDVARRQLHEAIGKVKRMVASLQEIEQGM